MNKINCINKLYIKKCLSYIGIFILSFSLIFSNLSTIKADTLNAGVDGHFSLQWTYSYELEENNWIAITTDDWDASNFYVDLTITFDDYYSGYMWVPHRSLGTSYFDFTIEGAECYGNNATNFRLDFSDCNLIKIHIQMPGSTLRTQIFQCSNWQETNNAIQALGYGNDFWDVGGSTLFYFTYPTNYTIALTDEHGIDDIYSAVDGVESSLSSMLSNLADINSSLTDSSDTSSILSQLLGINSYLDSIINEVTICHNDLSSILTALNTVNSNLNSVLSTLSSISTFSRIQMNYDRVADTMAYHHVKDISNLSITQIGDVGFQTATNYTIGTEYEYYILYAPYVWCCNWDYFVIDQLQKDTAYYDFYWVYYGTIYRMVCYLANSGTFQYSVYTYGNDGTVTNKSGSFVSYIYGTNSNPFANYVSLNGDVTIDNSGVESRLDQIKQVLESINQTISTDVMNKLDQIDDHLDNYTDYYDYDEMTWDEEFEALPIDITGPLNVYKDIGTELYSDIMSTNFKYIVYAGYIMLMLGVFL